VPGQHGPGVIDRLLPPVMGSILDLEEDGARRLRLYITGDTLHRPCLAEIPRRFPDVDAMLIHLGGTKMLGLLLTMDGRQGAEVTQLIRPRLTLPIHHDDYTVFSSPLSEFLAEAEKRGLTGIRPISRGETVELTGPASRSAPTMPAAGIHLPRSG